METKWNIQKCVLKFYKFFQIGNYHTIIINQKTSFGDLKKYIQEIIGQKCCIVMNRVHGAKLPNTRYITYEKEFIIEIGWPSHYEIHHVTVEGNSVDSSFCTRLFSSDESTALPFDGSDYPFLEEKHVNEFLAKNTHVTNHNRERLILANCIKKNDHIVEKLFTITPSRTKRKIAL
jgi:hypothetical protein